MCSTTTALALACITISSFAFQITLISEAYPPGSGVGGSQGADITIPAISSDLNTVCWSSATAYVPLDTNSFDDVYCRNVATNITTLISVNVLGQAANGPSYLAAISLSGRYVVSWSTASDLVANEMHFGYNVFRGDTLLGVTELVCVSSSGQQGNGDSFASPACISADGQRIVFHSFATNLVPLDSNNDYSVFLRDFTTNTTSLVSVDSFGVQPVIGLSAFSSIDDSGRYVVFESTAALVPEKTTTLYDIFLHDTVFGLTTRISVSSSGAEANGDSATSIISGDASVVVFEAHASTLDPVRANTTLSNIFLRRLADNSTTCVSVDNATGVAGLGDSYFGYPSRTGRYVVFQSNAQLTPVATAGVTNVFVRDVLANTSSLMSTSRAGDLATYSVYPVIAATNYTFVVTFASASGSGAFANNTGPLVDQLFLRTGDTIAPIASASLLPTVSSSVSLTPTASLSLGASPSLSPSISASPTASLSLGASPSPSLSSSPSPSTTATLPCTILTSTACIVSQPVQITTTMLIVGSNVVFNSSITLVGGNATLVVTGGSVTISSSAVIVVRLSQLPSSSSSGESLTLFTADGGVNVGANVSVQIDTSGVATPRCERVVSTPQRTTTSFGVLLTLQRDRSGAGCKHYSSSVKDLILEIVLPIGGVILIGCGAVIIFGVLYYLFRKGMCYRLFRYEQKEDRELRRRKNTSLLVRPIKDDEKTNL